MYTAHHYLECAHSHAIAAHNSGYHIRQLQYTHMHIHANSVCSIMYCRDNRHSVTNPLYSSTTNTNKGDMTLSEHKEYTHDNTKCCDDMNKEQKVELRSTAPSSAYQSVLQNPYDDHVSIKSDDVPCNQLGGYSATAQYDLPINKSLQPPGSDNDLKDVTQRGNCDDEDTTLAGESDHPEIVCQLPLSPEYVTPRNIPATS